MQSGDKLDRAAQLQRRTQQFALRCVRLFQAVRRGEETRIIARQLLRSGTSVGANYRASCRARTSREFVAKMRIVVEEIDETVYWIELLMETELLKRDLLQPLLIEAMNCLRSLPPPFIRRERDCRPNPQ
jgi:four helix bundle protein